MNPNLQSMFYSGDNQKRIDHVAVGSPIVNGEIVNLGSGLTGICTSPEGIAVGAIGSLAISEEFRIRKSGAGSVNFAKGALVGWDNTNKTAVVGGDWTLGIATKAAVNADNEVIVDINKVTPTQAVTLPTS
jgi:predicted RecA/RadA family phage recombinase